MKRFLYTLASLVLLASCSMDNVTEQSPGREIEFRVVTTKGAVVDMSNFAEFKLFAFREDGTLYYEDVYFFDGERFVSESKHTWPLDGSNINFQAYHQYGTRTSGVENATGGTLTLDGFSVEESISNQVDLITATATGNKSISGSVGLEFHHSLSQIEVRAKSTNPNYVCEVYGLRIANVAAAADFNIENGDWSLYDDTAIYEIEYDTPRLLGVDSITLMADDDDNAMLIPQQLNPWSPELDPTNEEGGVFLALKVRITLAESGSKVYPVVITRESDWIALPIDETWEAGWKYIYTWDIPKVCGYVDPYKNTEDVVDMILFPPGTPVRGEQIAIINPSVTDWR